MWFEEFKEDEIRLAKYRKLKADLFSHTVTRAQGGR